MLLKLNDNAPLYVQIYEQLREKVLLQKLAPGEKLPSSRDLAAALHVSRTSVIQAYEQLLAEGYTTSRRGAGTFIADTLPEPNFKSKAKSIVSRPADDVSPQLSAVGDRINQLFPKNWRPWLSQPEMQYDFRLGGATFADRSLKTWRRLVHDCVSKVSRRADDPQGYLPLRQAIVKELRLKRNCRCDETTVVIVNGSQQAFDLLSRLLVNPGDAVALEEPAYIGAEYVFNAHGAQLHPVPVDEEGIQVDHLQRISAAGKPPRLVYVTPSHQFPTGVVMSLSRRLALINWAQQHNAYILEDDYDGEFRYDGRPIESVQGLDDSSRTIYIGTFSKALFPSLRVGYLVLPAHLLDAFIALRWISDFQTSSLQQQALSRWMQEGHHEQHIRRMRKIYSQRRDCLVHSLNKYFDEDEIRISGINAGLHVLVQFKKVPVDKLQVLLERCAAKSLGVYPVGLTSEASSCTLTLGFTGVEVEDIEPGIQLLEKQVRVVSKT